jgi:hypothetical protein
VPIKEKNIVEKLIEALNIFLKYGNPKYPTHCERDALYIMEIKPDTVSDEDKKKLEELGFIIDEEEDCFMSFRYGSA